MLNGLLRCFILWIDEIQSVPANGDVRESLLRVG